MTNLVFYTNPQSRGRIVRWMLEEIACEYQTNVIEYGPALKSEPYILINPMGKLPAIVHAGKAVTECPAILAYLADAYPEAGLAPPLSQRQDYYRWLFFAAGPLESAITNNFLGVEVSEEQQRMAGYGNFELVLDTLEKAIASNPYIAGEQFSAADVYVGSHLRWGLQFGTIPERQVFREYFEKVSQRPAFARGNELDDALMEKSD